MSKTTFSAPWDAYFRKKKAGELDTGECHQHLTSEWIHWRENGLHVRPWADSSKGLSLHYIAKYFKSFRSISSENLKTWLTTIPSSSLSKRRHMHSAISSFAKFMNHKELMDSAEYQRIRALYPKQSPYHHRNQRIIYSEDLEKLIQHARKNHTRYQGLLNATLLIFLSETGLRVSEACRLKRTDLHFSAEPTKAFIKVHCGKGGKSRVVPFSKKAQDTVTEYLKHAPDGANVFLAFNPAQGYHVMDRSCVARRFRYLSLQIGIPFSAHSMRHYRITQWANNPRIPITVVQKWAGHSSLEITQEYVHIRDEDALLAAFD